VAFCGGFILWAFIFAWHTVYAKRPVFTLKIGWREWVAATGAGILMSILFFFLLDPSLRQTTPEDYPTSTSQWMAMTLFSLALNQLFLVFAPFAWSMRLGRRISIAMTFTVIFGAVVLLLKTRMSLNPFPIPLLARLLGTRLMLGLLAVSFYLRGGVWLASWFALLVQARHLVSLLAIESPHGS